MYVCLCKGLTEKDVRRVAQNGRVTAEMLIQELGLDDPACCGRCRRNIDQLVALTRNEPSTLRQLPLLPTPRRLVPSAG